MGNTAEGLDTYVIPGYSFTNLGINFHPLFGRPLAPGELVIQGAVLCEKSGRLSHGIRPETANNQSETTMQGAVNFHDYSLI